MMRFMLSTSMSWNFRAFTGAVSLKHQSMGSSGGQPLRLPRLHRRGLIEAVERRWRGRMVQDFRAFTGAVSLKQVSGERGGDRGEADFRAFTGAVSLKPSGTRSRAQQGHHFRAFTGAVSLKQTAIRFLRGQGSTLPRLHRRGLIEATSDTPAILAQSSTSAPSQARSH